MHFLQTVRQSKGSNAKTGFQTTKKIIPFKQASMDAGFQVINSNNNNNHRMQTIPVQSSPIQFKINITRPDDPSEEEADRIAEEVMHSPESESVHHHQHPSDAKINRKCKGCDEEDDYEKSIISRKSLNTTSLKKPKAVLAEAIGSSDSRIIPDEGYQLDYPTRSFMESRLGFDFSRVRIHTDTKAANSAKLLNASAYTVGQDIVFADGHYSPQQPAGKRLLAHELAHVMQQSQHPTYGDRSTATIRPNRGQKKKTVIPKTEQVAEQFLALGRLRKILVKHRTLQGGKSLELTRTLREEMLALMLQKDIAKIRFPAPSVDDVINQVEKSEISLFQGPETASEQTQRIITTEPAPGSSQPTAPGLVPDWLSLYDGGMAGFHVTVPSTHELPLEARLTAPFREKGIVLDSKLLQNLLSNYNLGVQEIEQLMKVLPPELSSHAPSLARWLAEKLQTTSLEATLKRESPAAASSSEQLKKRELIPAGEEKMKGQLSTVGSFKKCDKGDSLWRFNHHSVLIIHRCYMHGTNDLSSRQYAISYTQVVY